MNNSPTGAEQGFTLMEIMISLVLICLVVVSIIQLSSANLRNLSTSDDQVEALERANAKMREVLDLETLEDKSWQDVDDQGYAYDIVVAEIFKERSDSLAVRLMQITVTASYPKDKRVKQIALKTAKLIPKSDALKGDGKSAI